MADKKEPGQTAMEAYWEPIEVWADIDTDERAAWIRVESAVLEKAAMIAELSLFSNEAEPLQQAHNYACREIAAAIRAAKEG